MNKKLIALSLLIFLPLLAPTLAQAEEELPVAQCVLEEGQTGECLSVEPIVDQSVNQNVTTTSINGNSAGSESINPQPLTAELTNEQPLVINMPISNVDGATATSDLNAKTNYAFISFFILMLIVGALLYKSKTMKNKLLDSTKSSTLDDK